MTRAIDKVNNIPSDTLLKDPQLRVFLVAILAAINFSPEHEQDDIFDRIRKDYEESLGDMNRFVTDLEDNFYKDLYVDRHERIELSNLIQLKRFVLIHGLVGAGKSTLLRKTRQDYRQLPNCLFLYFDMAKAASIVYPVARPDFIPDLTKHIYDTIYNDHIQSRPISEKWNIYVLREDPNYSYIRQKVDAIMKRVIVTDEDWEEAFDHERIHDLYIANPSRPELTTLLKFLSKDQFVVLCLDNIDRYPLPPQRQMITWCNDINKSVGITVMLAIRDANLRRLRSESVAERGSGDDLADINFSNYLERLDAGQEKEVPLTNITKATIQSLLDQRMLFVLTHRDYSIIGDYLNSLLIDYNKLDENIPIDLETFEIRFNYIFNLISATFVDGDVYQLCNNSIREMLSIYFRFISMLMLNLEEEYNYKKIFYDEPQNRITKLRNYFYKYIICNGGSLPSIKYPAFPNIFDPCVHHIYQFDLKILQYCENYETTYPDRRLTYQEMLADFERLSIPRDYLKKRLKYLATPRGIQEMGFIVADTKDNSTIDEDTTIELLPSGHYFLDKISLSREYVFWNAFAADLNPPLFPGRIEYVSTYEDDTKYEIVHEALANHLIPWMEEELKFFSGEVFTPDQFVGSNIDYYNSLFGNDSRFYLSRLIGSMINTIHYSDMSGSRRRHYYLAFHALDKRCKDILRQYIQNY